MKQTNVNPLFSLAFWAIILVVFLAACSPAATPPPATPPSDAATTDPQTVPVIVPATEQPAAALDGATLMDERCSTCHTTKRITSAQLTAEEWTALVDRMVNKGAELNADERQTLIDYLAANYK